MRLYRSQIRVFRLLPLILSFWMLCALSPPWAAIAAENETASSEANSATDERNHVIINMVDEDIALLIQVIQKLTGKTFLIDSNVRGKVNIVSKDKLSPEDAYRLLESQLELMGFTLVPSGDAVLVLPISEARTKNVETRVTPEQLSDTKDPKDRLITQLIHLTYADVSKIKSTLTPLVSKNSVILAYADTNTLIIADVESNLKRLLHIIEVIDVPGIGREVSFVPLTNADPDEVVKILSTVFKTTISDEKNVSQKTLQFVADERTNAIIFVASEDDTIRINQLINYLDKEAPLGKGKAHVYTLKYADAEEMAAILQNIPESASTASGAGKDSAVVSGDITISADKSTNSLIVFADSADYEVILGIIEQLDIPRSMVYIEALIMEVTVDKTFDLGIEWSAFEDTTVDGDAAVLGGGFSISDGVDPTDMLYANGGVVGLVSGAVELTTSAGTVTVPNLGALIKALETNEDVHILYTPKLLSTDNLESNFVVGKKVPYQTRTSTTDNETYNSYDYQTVGLTLKITPHISEERNVRLEIFMEISALTGASTEFTTTPTTLNRTIDTTVIVKDKNMLVIGGLYDDSVTNQVKKVPLLGSIPILGRLFRFDSQIGSQTNLYLFITPRVIKSAAEANRLTSDVQDTLTPEESGIIKLYGPLVDSEDMTPSNTTEPAE